MSESSSLHGRLVSFRRSFRRSAGDRTIHDTEATGGGRTPANRAGSSDRRILKTGYLRSESPQNAGGDAGTAQPSAAGGGLAGRRPTAVTPYSLGVQARRFSWRLAATAAKARRKRGYEGSNGKKIAGTYGPHDQNPSKRVRQERHECDDTCGGGADEAKNGENAPKCVVSLRCVTNPYRGCAHQAASDQPGVSGLGGRHRSPCAGLGGVDPCGPQKKRGDQGQRLRRPAFPARATKPATPTPTHAQRRRMASSRHGPIPDTSPAAMAYATPRNSVLIAPSHAAQSGTVIVMLRFGAPPRFGVTSASRESSSPRRAPAPL